MVTSESPEKPFGLSRVSGIEDYQELEEKSEFCEQKFYKKTDVI